MLPHCAGLNGFTKCLSLTALRNQLFGTRVLGERAARAAQFIINTITYDRYAQLVLRAPVRATL